MYVKYVLHIERSELRTGDKIKRVGLYEFTLSVKWKRFASNLDFSVYLCLTNSANSKAKEAEFTTKSQLKTQPVWFLACWQMANYFNRGIFIISIKSLFLWFLQVLNSQRKLISLSNNSVLRHYVLKEYTAFHTWSFIVILANTDLKCASA